MNLAGLNIIPLKPNKSFDGQEYPTLPIENATGITNTIHLLNLLGVGL